MGVETLRVKIGTIGKVFQLTIVEADGVTPVDITGATVKLFVERNETKTCAVVDGPAGRADYEVVDGDYPNAGIYTAAAEISALPGGVISWTENFEFTVEATPEAAI